MSFFPTSKTHLAKTTMSTSCYAHGKLHPDVRDTEPKAARFSCAEMAVPQIWALSPAVPDSGDLAKVKPEFSLPSTGNTGFTCISTGTLLVLPQSAGHTSAAVSRLTCGWKSCRRKRGARRQVSETLKIQERYQDPNTMTFWRIFWRNYLLSSTRDTDLF